MRIGIDARLYGERGLGRYISELLLHLEEVDQANEYVIVMRRSTPHARGGVRGGGSDRFKFVTARSRWYSIAEQWELPRMFEHEQCDLVHIPHMNVPLWLRTPFVVTIHDLILMDFPSARGSRLPSPVFHVKHAMYQRVLRRAIRRAEHILTPSNYVKDRICSEFGRDEKDVTVTYEGVSTSLGDVGIHHRVIDGRKLYFLVVGSAYPHKNLEAVIDAFRDLQRTLQRTGLCNTTETRSLLLIVGKNDYFMQRLQREKGISSQSLRGGTTKQSDAKHRPERSEGSLRFARDDADNSIIVLGVVSDAELSSLYTNAAALVFASCEEGFGLPAFEAAQHGIPVIAGDRASVPEVMGRYALYVNPYDKEDIRRAMEEVLKNIEERVTVFPSGLTTGKVGWRDLVEKTLKVYSTFHSSSPRKQGSTS